jgi:mRNA interferase MazF
MVVKQGDLYWAILEGPGESESGYSHPQVVIQDNAINHSRINTVVVCGLTTNLKRAYLPGNVLLEVGEANLPKQSVVIVSQVSTIDKAQLGEYIGSLTPQRVNQIFAGMHFLQRMTEHHQTGQESHGKGERDS